MVRHFDHIFEGLREGNELHDGETGSVAGACAPRSGEKSHEDKRHRNFALVKVETDEGISG